MNTIPVCPPSPRWQQPKTDDILIDDFHAVMDKESFDMLYSYGMLIPSYVCEGRMWKSNPHEGEWHLLWFGSSTDDTNLLPIYSREIIVV